MKTIIDDTNPVNGVHINDVDPKNTIVGYWASDDCGLAQLQQACETHSRRWGFDYPIAPRDKKREKRKRNMFFWDTPQQAIVVAKASGHEVMVFDCWQDVAAWCVARTGEKAEEPLTTRADICSPPASCHSNPLRHNTLTVQISGPPCSGKTHFAEWLHATLADMKFRVTRRDGGEQMSAPVSPVTLDAWDERRVDIDVEHTTNLSPVGSPPDDPVSDKMSDRRRKLFADLALLKPQLTEEARKEIGQQVFDFVISYPFRPNED